MHRNVVVASSLVIIVALCIVAFFCYQTTIGTPKTVGYWALSIRALGCGHTTPNGTLQVPMNQTAINVTAFADEYSSFICWFFDGETLADHSDTVTIQRQQANSNHTLEASFGCGTPPMPTLTPSPTETPSPTPTLAPTMPVPTMQVNQNQSVTITLPSGVDVSYRLPWDSEPTIFNWGSTMNLSGLRLVVTNSEIGRSAVFPVKQGIYETTWGLSIRGLRITITEIHFQPNFLVILVEQST
jgi:hypothetical protein